MSLKHRPPNPPLMSELRQVSDEAQAVLGAMAELNAFPTDFPRDALTDLCSALQNLPEGTDEGCRPQLEAARNKLPLWRRKHFLVEEGGSGTDPETVIFYRDMLLDQKLNRLFAAVGTALDEYRVQAQDHTDDTVRAEEELNTSGDRGVANAVANRIDLETAAVSAGAALAQNLNPDSANADLLGRRVNDSANLTRIARSELRTSPMVRRWYRGIVRALKQSPRLIGAAGRAIQVGADIAGSLADWWSNFEHKTLKSLIDAVSDFGKTLEVIDASLARRRDGGSGGVPDPWPDLKVFRDIDEPWCPEMVVIPAGLTHEISEVS